MFIPTGESYVMQWEGGYFFTICVIVAREFDRNVLATLFDIIAHPV